MYRADVETRRPAFDAPTLTLYVSLRQIFRIWLIPGYSAPVALVTVLKLVPSPPASTSKYPLPSPSSPTPSPSNPAVSNTPATLSQPAHRAKTTYLIASQNDLYQVNEFVTFWSPLRVLWVAVLALQWMATAACVLGTVLGAPVSWAEENVVGGNRERGIRDVVIGG